MGYGIGGIPIVGDVWKGVFGDPEAVKAAYNEQIRASQQAQDQMQQFLMGQKGEAQALYKPIQHMFKSAYGTEGIQAPQTPQAPAGGPGPFARTYGGK